MAQLPPVNYSPGAPVDAETIYKESLYAPASNITNVSQLTFEILNGGMTIANYSGGANKLKAHQIAMGSMAQGYYFGFNRTDFMYGEQFNDSTSTTSSVTHATERLVQAGLSFNVFLPWDTKVVMYGYQAMFVHDATEWNVAASGSDPEITGSEFYDMSLLCGTNLSTSTLSTTSTNPSLFLYHKMPHNRYATDVGGTVTDGSDTYSAPALETSFRFVSKTGMIEGASAPSKGHLQVKVCVGAQIKQNDPRKSKIKTPSGSIWLVALR